MDPILFGLDVLCRFLRAVELLVESLSLSLSLLVSLYDFYDLTRDSPNVKTKRSCCAY